MTDNKTNAMAAQTARQNLTVLKNQLAADSVRAQFANALGRHSDTFVASIIDLYTSDPQLQACKPQDVIAQALKAAVMKLPISRALGFAYIVVYNNSKKVRDPRTGREEWVKEPTPTFIPGYKGYIQMAMRTGQYRTINADVVYEGELGQVDKLTGTIRLDGRRTSDRVVGYFCHFELLNGFGKTLYMSVEEMAAYARRYAPGVPRGVTAAQLAERAQTGEAGKQVGWMGNFNDMAVKTVVRRLLSKYGYLSVEMQDAVAGDITAEADATATRDEALQAAPQDVALDEVSYEDVNVDTATGEVLPPPAPAEPLPDERPANEPTAFKVDDSPAMPQPAETPAMPEY